MIVSLMVAALAAGQSECPAKVKGVVCYHQAQFRCPPKMKRTRKGCWDGQRLYVYRYTTKRTSSAIVGAAQHR